MTKMQVLAPAKINFSLKILGRRDDGFHEIETLIAPISLYDKIDIEKQSRWIDFSCDDPTVPSGDENLVVRVAKAFFEKTKISGGVGIKLHKKIPHGAGLGGGSSDAAATLRALAKVWRVDRQSVREAAVTLGADVPYFLEGGTVLGLERGDVLFPLPDHPRRWVVLVIPPFGVSTQEAYAWWDESRRDRGPKRGRDRARSARSLALPDEVAENDLQSAVSKRHPEISRIVASLRRAGSSCSAMSGSGSAVFGLFETKGAAFDAAGALKRGNRSAIVTRTLTRAECRRLAAK